MYPSPLHKAAHCQQAAIPALLQGGHDPNALCPDGKPPLSMARGFSEYVRLLERYTVHGVDVYGRSPLHHAAIRGDSALFDFLCSVGYDPHAPDATGKTAMRHYRESLLTDYLLDVPLTRAEVQQTLHCDPNTSHRNPLASALLAGWHDLASVLLARGANPDLLLANGQTPRAIGACRL